MDKHELKTWSKYFAEIYRGNKTFEIRRNDRDYKVGDKLILREWCLDKNDYTGLSITKRVSYILKDAEGFGLKDGYVIMGFENDWAF